MVESASDDILKDAQTVDVAFMVVGDPFGYILLQAPCAVLRYFLGSADRKLEQLRILTSSFAPES
jgi:hypothetical protein